MEITTTTAISIEPYEIQIGFSKKVGGKIDSVMTMQEALRNIKEGAHRAEVEKYRFFIRDNAPTPAEKTKKHRDLKMRLLGAYYPSANGAGERKTLSKKEHSGWIQIDIDEHPAHAAFGELGTPELDRALREALKACPFVAAFCRSATGKLGQYFALAYSPEITNEEIAKEYSALLRLLLAQYFGVYCDPDRNGAVNEARFVTYDPELIRKPSEESEGAGAFSALTRKAMEEWAVSHPPIEPGTGNPSWWYTGDAEHLIKEVRSASQGYAKKCSTNGRGFDWSKGPAGPAGAFAKMLRNIESTLFDKPSLDQLSHLMNWFVYYSTGEGIYEKDKKEWSRLVREYVSKEQASNEVGAEAEENQHRSRDGSRSRSRSRNNEMYSRPPYFSYSNDNAEGDEHMPFKEEQDIRITGFDESVGCLFEEDGEKLFVTRYDSALRVLAVRKDPLRKDGLHHSYEWRTFEGEKRSGRGAVSEWLKSVDTVDVFNAADFCNLEQDVAVEINVKRRTIKFNSAWRSASVEPETEISNEDCERWLELAKENRNRKANWDEWSYLMNSLAYAVQGYHISKERPVSVVIMDGGSTAKTDLMRTVAQFPMKVSFADMNNLEPGKIGDTILVDNDIVIIEEAGDLSKQDLDKLKRIADAKFINTRRLYKETKTEKVKALVIVLTNSTKVTINKSTTRKLAFLTGGDNGLEGNEFDSDVEAWFKKVAASKRLVHVLYNRLRKQKVVLAEAQISPKESTANIKALNKDELLALLYAIEDGTSGFEAINKGEGCPSNVREGHVVLLQALKQFLLHCDRNILAGKSNIAQVLEKYIDKGELDWTLLKSGKNYTYVIVKRSKENEPVSNHEETKVSLKSGTYALSEGAPGAIAKIAETECRVVYTTPIEPEGKTPSAVALENVSNCGGAAAHILEGAQDELIPTLRSEEVAQVAIVKELYNLMLDAEVDGVKDKAVLKITAAECKTHSKDTEEKVVESFIELKNEDFDALIESYWNELPEKIEPRRPLSTKNWLFLSKKLNGQTVYFDREGNFGLALRDE